MLLTPRSFACKHSGKLRERVENAKIALQLHSRSLEVQKELIDTTSAKNFNLQQDQVFRLKDPLRREDQ